MNYDKLDKRIMDMLQYESDDYLVNINLKNNVSDKLKDYQLLHVFNLLTALRNNRIVLDGSDTGTGKTYTALAVCSQLRLKPIIVCPKIIMGKWREVCKYFRVRPLSIVNYETARNGKEYYGDKRVESKYIKPILNEDEDIIDYDWKVPKYTVIIFDEAHKCKNASSLNSKLMLATKKLRWTNVLLLSATIADTPESFHVFGYMLGLYKSLRQAKNWINGMLREDKNYIGSAPKVSAMNRKIFPFCGSRMCIEDLGDKFPDNQVIAECYNLDEIGKREIDNIYRNMKKLMGETGTEALVALGKERQKLEMLKVPIFESLIRNHLENGFSVVVFVNFTKTLKTLGSIFRTDCTIHGSQDSHKRDINISDFQENKKNLIICNIKAGGQGISLHDKYGKKRVSLISPTWSSIDLVQALGRIHREGSRTPALQRVVFCSDTCEETVCKNIKEKLEFTSKLNDTDLLDVKI